MKRRELLQSLLALPLVGVTLKKKMEAQAVPVTKTEDLDQMVQFGHMDEREAGGISTSTSTVGGPYPCQPYSPVYEQAKNGKCPKCKAPASEAVREGAVGVVQYEGPRCTTWMEYDMKCKRCGTRYKARPEIHT